MTSGAQAQTVADHEATALDSTVSEDAQAPVAVEAATLGVVPIVPADAPLELGRWTLGASFGDDLQVFDLGAMIPLMRAGSSVLFLNPRGVLLEDQAQEMSLGLVARRGLCGDTMIVGVNAFYDVQWTEQNNTFHQLGGGVELLSRWLDARANYYYPLSDAKESGTSEDVTVTATGSRRTTTTTRYRTQEEALEGFDVELGVWLPYLSRVVPTAVYVGYYDLEADDSGQSVEGFSARVEARLHPSVTLDVEWFEESAYRQSETVVGLRLHLPLKVWKGAEMNRGGDRVSEFLLRFDEPVQRDFRLRTLTTSQVADTQQSTTITRSAKQPAPDPVQPAKVCRSYATLNNNGQVVIITVCE